MPGNMSGENKGLACSDLHIHTVLSPAIGEMVVSETGKQ